MSKLSNYRPSYYLDDTVRVMLEQVLPSDAINDVTVDLCVAILRDYIRNRFHSDVFKSDSDTLKRLCNRICEIRS